MQFNIPYHHVKLFKSIYVYTCYATYMIFIYIHVYNAPFQYQICVLSGRARDKSNAFVGEIRFYSLFYGIAHK